jgi:hypothetical protein
MDIANPYSLSKNEVHIWTIFLPEFSNHIDLLSGYLSQAELDKAKSFAYPHLKERYIISRAILRELLVKYLKKNRKKFNFF